MTEYVPAIRWDPENQRLVDANGMTLATSDVGDAYTLEYESSNSLTAKDLSDALSAVLEFYKDRWDIPSINLYIYYNPEAVGIRRTPWATMYEGTDEDLLCVTQNLAGFEQYLEVVWPRNIPFNEEKAWDLTSPLLNQLGMSRISVNHLTGPANDPPVCGIRVKTPENMTVRDMAYVNSSLRDIAMNRSNTMDPQHLYAAIESGEISSLLGLIECETIDAKRTHYPKGDGKKRIDIAVDVAAFANSSKGGIIIIGARTGKDAHGRDVIVDAGGCPIDQGAQDRYLSIVDSLVHPAIESLRMCRIASTLGELFAILIPPQPAERIPFLVRGGATTDDRTSSALFQVPIRTGDSNRSMRIEEIHRHLQSFGGTGN